jgi:hypothetical protein
MAKVLEPGNDVVLLTSWELYHNLVPPVAVIVGL